MNVRGFRQKEDGRWYRYIPVGYEASIEGDEIVLTKKRWKPREGESYYCPTFTSDILFGIEELIWYDDKFDKDTYDNHLVFRTREECQEFCDKMNKDIAAIISQQTERAMQQTEQGEQTGTRAAAEPQPTEKEEEE